MPVGIGLLPVGTVPTPLKQWRCLAMQTCITYEPNLDLFYSLEEVRFPCVIVQFSTILNVWRFGLEKTSSKMTYFFVDSDFKPQSINQTDRRNHYCEFHGHWVTTAFSALTLLAGRQEEHPTCKNWVMRWLHMIQLMLLPSLNPIVSCLI